MNPPSVEREIFTFAVLVGAMSVLALSHVTVIAEPLGTEPPESGEVTRNGPAFVASRRVVSPLLTPPLPSRAVRRKWRERGVALVPAKPT